jgi:hypothetical protein
MTLSEAPIRCTAVPLDVTCKQSLSQSQVNGNMIVSSIRRVEEPAGSKHHEIGTSRPVGIRAAVGVHNDIIADDKRTSNKAGSRHAFGTLLPPCPERRCCGPWALPPGAGRHATTKSRITEA